MFNTCVLYKLKGFKVSSHKYCSVTNVIDTSLLSSLPVILEACLTFLLVAMLNYIATLQAKLYRLQKHVKKLKKSLYIVGATGHGSMTESAASRTTEWRRKIAASKHYEMIKSVSCGAFDIYSQIVTDYISGNPLCKAKRLLTKYIIRDHNTLVEEMDQDHDTIIHRALQCIRNGWSKRSLAAFRLSVCNQTLNYLI